MSDGTAVNFVNINSSAGAFVTLTGTVLSKAISILEDASANAGTGQGLIYNLVDPVNTTNPLNPVWKGPFQIAPQTEPITLGDLYQIHGEIGGSVANGPNVLVGVGVTLPLPYLQVKSAGLASAIRITEFE